MKKTALALLFAFFFLSPKAQNPDYKSLWLRADSLLDIGLPQSALEVVQRAEQLAKAENNSPQRIKALIYRINIKGYISDDDLAAQIQQFEAEARVYSFPDKALLQSMMAELYWSYYMNNRWEIDDRTQTTSPDTADIRTWDFMAFWQKINTLYSASLAHQGLDKVEVSKYAALIEKGDSTADFYPSLYDLLARRVLRFYKNDGIRVVSFAETFVLTAKQALAPIEQFIATDFNYKDTAGSECRAIKLYSELLKHYIATGNVPALILTDIDRLSYCAGLVKENDKNQLQVEELERMLKKYAGRPATIYVYSRLAAIYYCSEYYNYYDEQNTPGFCNNAKALQYCNEGIEKFPEEKETDNLRRIKSQVLQKQLNLEVEATNLPGRYFKIHAQSKNVDSLYYRIIAISKDSLEKIRSNYYPYNGRPIDNADRLFAEKLYSLSAVRQGVAPLPVSAEYKMLGTEVIMEPLGVGHYVLISSAKADFLANDNQFNYYHFWCSEYLLARHDTKADEVVLYLRSASDGKPIKDAVVRFYKNQYYNYDNPGDELYAEKITGSDGKIVLQSATNYIRLRAEVWVKGRQVLASGDIYTVYSYNSNYERQYTTHFFTDRGIYRPGQTLYFKGLVTKKDDVDKKSSIGTGLQTTVTLSDPNGRKVGEVEATTNEYGSYSGSFVLPQNTVTGIFTLQDIYSSTTVQVEEYKRPKFKADFDTLAAAYALNDSVTLTGIVKAFAGNNISGAMVKYSVSRSEYAFPYFYKYYYEPPSTAVIETGIAETDANGRFTITFKALPDKGDVSKNYSFEISADVTDINGETHSAATSLNIGARSVFATVLAPEILFNDKPAEITVNAENLQGKAVAVSGKLEITEIQVPEKTYRVRRWNVPDTLLYSKEYHDKLFPFDAYKDEYLQENWKTGKTVFSQNINAGDTRWEGAKGLKPGYYKITFEYTDPKTGTVDKDVRYVSVVDKKGKQPLAEKPLAIITLNDNGKPAQPGQTLEVLVSSNIKNAKIYYWIDHDEKPSEIVEGKAKKGAFVLKVPVAEDDRGGFDIHAFVIFQNRIYTETLNVRVPWSNKDLQVEVKTFRDKLLPGSQEQWELTIKGPASEKVSAEVLASLYDASLDQFRDNRWAQPYLWGSKRYNERIYLSSGGIESGINIFNFSFTVFPYYILQPDEINWFGLMNSRYDRMVLGFRGVKPGLYETRAWDFGDDADADKKAPVAKAIQDPESPDDIYQVHSYNANATTDVTLQQAQPGGQLTKIRSDFRETAFFYPNLHTNENGETVIRFTVPDALTQWNFQVFAHTKSLQTGYMLKEAISQKPLMVQPNLPRFLRLGDEIEINAKVVNLSENMLSPYVTLELYDALTDKPLAVFNNTNSMQLPQLQAGSSDVAKWRIKVPDGIEALKIMIKAVDRTFTDAESNVLPVLSDRMLVTEALPMPFSGSKPKTFEFKKLAESGKSTTLKQHKLTVEFTANPVWYAIQALPYLMEFPYECAEQTFNRYYANALGFHIANSDSKIKSVFDWWKSKQQQGEGNAFLSNLEKNPELKNILLTESPWLAEGQNETERKQRLGLFFDENNVRVALTTNLEKLAQMQQPNGAFPWFSGMGENEYITRYIVAGFGKLKNAGLDPEQPPTMEDVAMSALSYIRKKAAAQYDDLLKHKADLGKNNLGFAQVQFLYASSYFDTARVFSETDKTAFHYWVGQAQQYWTKRDKMSQAMIALALYRLGDKKTPAAIIKSLKEFALHNEEMGMYWKDVTGGYGWTDAPIETQSVLIEAFAEIEPDSTWRIDQMKKWLLKQKQVQDWKTTKATADACYALVMEGSNWLQNDYEVNISLGATAIDTKNDPETKGEAGTGYIKKSFTKDEVKPEMAKVTVTPVDGANIPVAWGAVYWQYFEQLDKITAAQTSLYLKKELYVEKTTANGLVLELLKEGQAVKIGDKLVVRIVLKADRDFEYVHLKDMRAAALEPLTTVSGYKWQGGIGYYESIRDASMNFFMDYLHKGTYVFEYPLRVSQAGSFQNGIATIQCMYAPEFNSHSDGLLLKSE